MANDRTKTPIQSIEVERSDGSTVVLRPRRDLRIADNIDEDMRRHAALLGWYGQVLEEAQYVMKQYKYAWTSLTETLYKKLHRENQQVDKNERLTETAMKRIINTNEDVRSAIEDYMAAAHTYRLVSYAHAALVERGNMLRSLNKNEREQYNKTL